MRLPRSTGLGPREAGPPLPTPCHPSGGKGGLRARPRLHPAPPWGRGGRGGGAGRRCCDLDLARGPAPQPHTRDAERPGDGALGRLLPRSRVDEPCPAGGQERAEFRKRHGGRCGGASVPGWAGLPRLPPGEACAPQPLPVPLPPPPSSRGHMWAGRGPQAPQVPAAMALTTTTRRRNAARPGLAHRARISTALPGTRAGAGREAPPPAAPVHRAADARPPPQETLFAARRWSPRVARLRAAEHKSSPPLQCQPDSLHSEHSVPLRSGALKRRKNRRQLGL